MKKEYVKPSLTVLGDARELTAQNNTPLYVDVAQGTPINQGPIAGS